MKIPFARIDCSGNELAYVQEVLESGWLTTASKAAELERRFAEMVSCKHACAVNSCTSALHLALEALNVGPGDKVLVPTWTFTATAEVVRYMGADPIFLDVDYGTFAITPEIVESAILKNQDAKFLIVVHFGGQVAPMLKNVQDGILDICRRHGVSIVEDAAHAFPARDGSAPVGSIGDITCFSFYANKTITTGEGGMLTTDNEEIASRVRLMRLHGINRDVWDRFTSSNVNWEYDVRAPGFKYNMPDINAAIGLAQLERVDQMRADRQRCAEYYKEHLSSFECLDLPVVRVSAEDHAWHIFPIVVNDKCRIGRNQLIELLAKDGIGTSVHYKPLHRMSYYKDKYQLIPEDFSTAERLWKGCLSLPIYSSLQDEELAYIVGRLKKHLG